MVTMFFGMLPMRQSLIFVLFLFISLIAVSQEPAADTSKSMSLPDVIIRAYEHTHKLKEIPSGINYIGRNNLERFGQASIVSAVNTMPGARMEERSPGSYRFNIRGSSLRSPFGVRNVKVYYNDIPITDPGGQTYLNQLGYYNFNSLEVIKGPGSSLYGAGTGGVLLIENLTENEQAGVVSEYSTGSYDLQNIYVALSTGSKKLVSRGSFQHQQSNGYRNQSELNRNVHSWTGLFRFNEDKYLKTTFLYGDLFYETPGALTKAEFNADPRSARPPAGSFPGAEQARASVRQKSFVTGVSYTQKFAPRWVNKSVLYGMFTSLRNPNIRNYDKTSEPHVGGRTIFRYGLPLKEGKIDFDLGGEWQEGFSSVSIHKNLNGNADSLRSMDDINNRQQFVFTQVVAEWKSWLLTGGLSWNMMKVKLERFTPASSGKLQRKFDDEFSPRIALMKRFMPWGMNLNVYGSVSKGFSPPASSELMPTGGAVNYELDAEEGTSYELGCKTIINKVFYVDVNAFLFSLDNTIVQRRDAGGGDYYINAGQTKQHGVETYTGYSLFRNSANQGLIWLSYTWHDFHYKEFKQLNNDFAGKQMPATAPHALSSGINIELKNGLLAALTYYFSDRIPLNDANTEYADAFHLGGTKIGFQKLVNNKWRFRLTAGVDNLADQKYSLGNDINAFGGRYYNAAPGRNFYLSARVEWISRKILQ